MARLERSEAREAKLMSQLTTLISQQQQQQQQQLVSRDTIYEEDRARLQTTDSSKPAARDNSLA